MNDRCTQEQLRGSEVCLKLAAVLLSEGLSSEEKESLARLIVQVLCEEQKQEHE